MESKCIYIYIYTRIQARAKARAFILAVTRFWSEVWHRYNHVKTTIRRPLPLTNICMETHEGGMIWIECKRNQPRGEHIYLNRAKGMPLSFSKQVTSWKAEYDHGGATFIQKGIQNHGNNYKRTSKRAKGIPKCNPAEMLRKRNRTRQHLEATCPIWGATCAPIGVWRGS